MSSFDDAVIIVLKNEGGYTNDPNDNGSETMLGVSRRFLNDNPKWYEVYPQLKNSLKESVSVEIASDIFKTDFWLPLRLDYVNSQPIAAKMLDAGVNMGQYYAVLCAQRALRSSHIQVNEDGKIGQQTINTLNQCNEIGFMFAYRSELAGHYRMIVEKNPTQKCFLNGWLSRAYQ